MSHASVRRDGAAEGAHPPRTGTERLLGAFRPERRSVVAYVPLGDPVTGGDAVLDAYRASGVAVLEIGIPTRDPWLDGPEVAGSMRRAIDARVDPGEIARRLARWRAGLPVPSPAIVWFTYPDLPLAEIEHAAGLGAIDGLLLLEEGRHPLSTRVPGFLASLGLAHCAFLPWEPAGDDLRAAERATGYVMVQARPGPTGADRDPEVPVRQVELAREHARGRPVVAGFGIHDAATVRRVIEAGVDGVVVGSACIRALREGGAEGLRDLLLPLVAAASVPRRLGAGAGAGGR